MADVVPEMIPAAAADRTMAHEEDTVEAVVARGRQNKSTLVDSEAEVAVNDAANTAPKQHADQRLRTKPHGQPKHEARQIDPANVRDSRSNFLAVAHNLEEVAARYYPNFRTVHAQRIDSVVRRCWLLGWKIRFQAEAACRYYRIDNEEAVVVAVRRTNSFLLGFQVDIVVEVAEERPLTLLVESLQCPLATKSHQG